jgi:TolB protein
MDRGLRAGRSFVSNGPMLSLLVNSKSIGDELKLASAGEVTVEATASSQFPLNRVEILYNGAVVATSSPAKQALTAKLEKTIPVARSGWLALRVVGPAVGDVKDEWVYAHTSPVYVVVDDKRTGSREDARYFLAWIDRLWETILDRERIPGQKAQEEVQAEVDKARKVYREIAESGW